MKVLSPVSTLSTCRHQIQSGADEIYVGLDVDTFHSISFSGRGRFSFKGKRISPDYDELVEIVKLAHASNVKVNYAANTVFKSNSVNDQYQKAYLNYVDMGIQAGVDHVIVGDMGNLVLMKEKGFSIPLVASVFLATFNLDTIKFMEKYGVIRTCLPHHMKLSEIKEIKENTDVEIEIFAGVGCSNIDGRCGFMHNTGENIEFGIPCKAKYRTEDGYEGSILDSTLDCLLCSLPVLCEMGIDVLKIIGRDQSVAFTSSMTRIHKELIKRIEEGEKISKTEIDEYIKEYPWWKGSFCQMQKCKYKNVTNVKSFI